MKSKRKDVPSGALIPKILGCSRGAISDFLIIGTISIYFVYYCLQMNSGIDFTDEGKHLNDAAYPNNYSNQVTQYGYLLHPVFRLLNFDLFSYRLANFSLVFTLGILSFFMVAHLCGLKSYFTVSRLYSYGFITGIIFLTFFDMWLPTPNYYSLTFQFIAMCWLTFTFFFLDKDTFKAIPKLALACFPLACLFLIKPTSFIILSAAIIISIFFLQKKWRVYTPLLILFVTIYLVIFSKIIFGNFLMLFYQILVGTKLTQDLDPQYGFSELIKIDTLPFSKWVLLELGLLWFFTKVSWYKLSLVPKKIVLLLVLIYFAIFFLIAKSLEVFSSEKNYHFLLLGLVVTMLGVRPFGKFRSNKSSVVIKFQYILLLLPFSYSFGTNQNQWEASKLVTCFLLIFSILNISTMASDSKNLILMRYMMIASVLISFLIISTAANNPYRQPNSVIQNKNLVSNIPKLSSVRLNPDYADSLTGLSRRLNYAGFEINTPVIDLSGQSPTLIYLIDGLSLGNSWLIGGYPGSVKVAQKQLSAVSCLDLGRAWILEEPNGPRSLDFENLLSSFGLERVDYKIVAKWFTPSGAGGYPLKRLQYFLKPLDPVKLSKGLVNCAN